MEEIDGRLAIPETREGLTPGHTTGPAGAPHHGSPGFGAGVSATQCETFGPAGLAPRPEMQLHADHQSRSGITPRIPPEDHMPKGCSLLSMEPLREWFCSGADMTSPAEYEAALCQIEYDPPDIRQYSDNTHSSLEGVQFATVTVDVIQRGEALAIFDRDLIIHFQQISKAAALYVRALLGGIKRALEVYRRVDDATYSYPWSLPTTEEVWLSHAEGVLMVALTSMNLPQEAWPSARLLRAVPNCRLVLMLAYHIC